MYKTAESITPMHPDKICDRISDAILDACLKQDENSRVAMETMGGHNLITVTGELSSNAEIDIQSIVRAVIGDSYGVQANISRQSTEIARGVDGGGAGDQGIMVGYACNENIDLIPRELYLARSLCRFIYAAHASDGKVQITTKGEQVTALVASFCGLSRDKLLGLISDWRDQMKISDDMKIYANPAGDWNQGGFAADTGLTGRKLACDNYGPQIPIGGGAFSGKDASKVDRSGAYMARKIAVDLLKKYQAKEVIVKLAYAIGISEPLMVTAEITHINGSKEELDVVGYDLTPTGIARFLDLKKPQYEQVAAWGSFGNGFKWDL
ncbi:MAG: methionine adenosyltransferase domain-containing protein [bacterium]|nr:methionine adenosyltransferase domain-containing protein [bacterium]